MVHFTNSLDHVRVAAPCSADWERMAGTERVRFCGHCTKNVYNLSSMTRREAEALIVQTEGQLCVRFYRRADGSILTQNCPVGLRALKRRASRAVNATISTLLGFLAGVGLSAGLRQTNSKTFPAVENDEQLPITGDLMAPIVMGAMITTSPIVQKPVVGCVQHAPEVLDEVWVKGKVAITDADVRHQERQKNRRNIKSAR